MVSEGKKDVTVFSYPVSFEPPRFSEIVVEENLFTRISMNNCVPLGVEGEPSLPVFPVRLLLPQGSHLVNVDVKPRSESKIKVDFGEKPVFPEQEPLFFSSEKKVKFQMKSELYGSDAVFPNQLFSDVGVGMSHGFQIVTVLVCPVKYSPGRGMLWYYPEMTVEVEVRNEPSVLGRENSLFRASVSDVEEVQSLVLNPELVEEYVTSPLSTVESFSGGLCSSGDTYEFVLITSESLCNSSGEEYSWDDLVNHRKSFSGLNSILVTVEEIDACSAYWNATSLFNDSAAHIREFIRDAYLNWETEFVLLGGDWDAGNVEKQIVPQRTFTVDQCYETYDTMPADIYYSNLDGDWYAEEFGCWGGGRSSSANDLYAEVCVGRVTVDDVEQVSTVVKKIISYDLYADPDFIDKVVFFGGNLGWPIKSYDYMEDLRNGTGDYICGTDGFVQWNENNPHYAFNISERVYYNWGDSIPADYKSLINNDKACLINHLSHGNPTYALDMTLAELDALSNSKYFFSYSAQCLSGRFTVGDTAEKQIMCLNESNGAFAVVWNTGYGWGSGYSTNGSSQFLHRNFLHYLFNVSSIQDWFIGKAHHYSKDVLSAYISNNGWHYCWAYTFYSAHLFGDPAQKFRIEGYEHDVMVTDIDVSDHVAPNDEVIVNTTIFNIGLNNESNIEVCFLVEGVEQDSFVIDNLISSQSCTVSFNWSTPSIPADGDVDICVNATAVPGENVTGNNKLEMTVVVGEDIAVTNLVVADVLKYTQTSFSAYVSNLGANNQNSVLVRFKVENLTVNSTVISLDRGEGEMVSFGWDAHGYLVGNYWVEIAADVVVNEQYVVNQNRNSSVLVYAPINITGLTVTPSLQSINSFVNVSCTVISEDPLNEVRITIPSVGNVLMDNRGDVYFYNQTYGLVGDYLVEIYAATDNVNEFATDVFTIYNPGQLVHNVEQNEDYYTIQEAINDANSNETIIIPVGKFIGNLQVNQSVHIIGSGKTSTIISGGNVTCCFNVTSNFVNISGCKIVYGFPEGIKLFNVSFCSIYDNNISRCDVLDTGYGVYVVHGRQNTIHKNWFYRNEITIYCYGDGTLGGGYMTNNSNIISFNTIIQKGDGNGFILSRSCWNKIYNNSITGALEWDGGGIEISSYSHYNDVFNNTIDLSNARPGVSCSNAYFNKIHHNNISVQITMNNNIRHAAINTLASRYTTITHNYISSNRDGIRLQSSSTGTCIENNTIIGYENEESYDYVRAGVNFQTYSYSDEQVTVGYCKISGWDVGVYYSEYLGRGPETSHIVHNCDIFGNDLWGANNEVSYEPINASYNYWGAPDGPGGVGMGSGDNVSENVTYQPYRMQSVFQPSESPQIVSENPLHQSTNVAVGMISLCVSIYDAQGDLLTVSFRTNKSGVWSTIGSNNSVGNGTYQQTLEFDQFGTCYWWSVNCTDGVLWTNETYFFITEQPPVNNPPNMFNEQPENQSTNIPITTNTLQITIQDPEGDPFNWTITTQPNIGTNTQTTTTNGTKTCTINNLAYSTTYHWHINTTDTGSNNWTNHTYTFTTENKPKTPSSPGGYVPPIIVEDDVEVKNNTPPQKPQTPLGITQVFMGEEISYSTKTYDIDGDIVRYQFDWGDGTKSEWSSYIAGNETFSLTKRWDTIGEFVLRVIAQDEQGENSSWSNSVLITVIVNEENNNCFLINYSFLDSSDKTKIQFHALNYTLFNGTIASIFWDFGDGTNATGAQPIHTYKQSGTYTVTVTVIDMSGNIVTQDLTINVQASENNEEMLSVESFPWIYLLILIPIFLILLFFIRKKPFWIYSLLISVRLRNPFYQKRSLKIRRINREIKSLEKEMLDEKRETFSDYSAPYLKGDMVEENDRDFEIDAPIEKDVKKQVQSTSLVEEPRIQLEEEINHILKEKAKSFNDLDVDEISRLTIDIVLELKNKEKHKRREDLKDFSNKVEDVETKVDGLFLKQQNKNLDDTQNV